MRYLLETLPVILFASWLFSLVFERPFMSQTRKQKVPRRQAPQVTAIPLRTVDGYQNPTEPEVEETPNSDRLTTFPSVTNPEMI